MSSPIPARLLDPPAIAVVLVTRQPVGLAATLQGLLTQTLEPRSFEVVVIAESLDRRCHQIVEESSTRLPVVLVKQAWSGFAAAKNLGVLMTAAPLVLFLRDAEVAAPGLLVEHVDSHRSFPELGHAVMGRIELAGAARCDALSAFAISERAALAAPLSQVLRYDDRAFEKGSTSFKRALLLRVGLFDSGMGDAEDVELAVRLAGHGVQVIPNPRAVTQREVVVPAEQWLDQSKSLGRALHQCQAIHGQELISHWIGHEGTEDGWQAISAHYFSVVETARKICRMTKVAADAGIPLAPSERDAAMHAFSEASRYVRARGMHEARVAEALMPVDARSTRAKAARTEHLRLWLTSVGQYVDWLNLWHASSKERYERRRVESQISAGPADVYRGYCWVCRRIVDFSIDARFMEFVDGEERPNWREQLTCPQCLLNSRKRAAAQAVEEILKLGRPSSILLAEQTTALYRALRTAYPRLVGFEYFGGAAASADGIKDGLNNEDLTALSFDAESFDAVLAFDVLEHISDTNQAFRESWRVLVEGGQLLFSIPFTFSEHSVRRAIQHDDGSVEHFLERELHDDPVNPSGCLAFHSFGWAVLDEVRAAGFEDVRGVQYWSRELAHFGTQLLFIARKPVPQPAG